MKDARLASYNAAKSSFSNGEALMCYFHVVLNCKKEKNLIPQEHQDFIFKKSLRRLHLTMRNYKQFVDFCKENCNEFAKYVFSSWLSFSW